MMHARSFNSKGIGAALLAVFFLLPADASHAHRVNVFAWVEGQTVYTESSFPGGKAVKAGQIVVYDDKTGEPLLEGTTDDLGKFSFPVPRRAPLRVELTAGMGHGNEWIVPVEEISVAAGVPAPETTRAAGEKTGSAPRDQTASSAVDSGPSAAEIEAVMEKVLDRRLSPLVRQVAELRRKEVSVVDIVGGIGYIIGLAGLGVYLHYRRKVKELKER